MTPDALDVAVRAYATRADSDPRKQRGSTWKPTRALVFDCESRTDPGQQLTFGVWRCYDVSWHADRPEPDLSCWEEGIFSDEHLTTRERRVIAKAQADSPRSTA